MPRTRAKSKEKEITPSDKLSKLKDTIPNYFNKNNIVKTNIEVLDKALSGGLEVGNVIQIVSESGMGKTTILLQLCYKLCSNGNQVLYIDAEGSVSYETLASIGLNTYMNKEFIYVRESTFQNVEKVLDDFINTNLIKYVFIDSIACIVPDRFFDINKDKKISITTNHSLHSSRPLTLFMQKYNSLAKSKGITFVLSNQYRNKVDMIQGTLLKEYGSKTVKYNSDIIIRINTIKSSATTTENDNSSSEEFKRITKTFGRGNSLELEIIKSNKDSPGRKYPFYLIYGRGISPTLTLIFDYLESKKLSRNGASYVLHYEDKNISLHGINNVYDYFCTNSDSLIKDLSK